MPVIRDTINLNSEYKLNIHNIIKRFTKFFRISNEKNYNVPPENFKYFIKKNNQNTISEEEILVLTVSRYESSIELIINLRDFYVIGYILNNNVYYFKEFTAKENKNGKALLHILKNVLNPLQKKFDEKNIMNFSPNYTLLMPGDQDVEFSAATIGNLSSLKQAPPHEDIHKKTIVLLILVSAEAFRFFKVRNEIAKVFETEAFVNTDVWGVITNYFTLEEIDIGLIETTSFSWRSLKEEYLLWWDTISSLTEQKEFNGKNLKSRFECLTILNKEQ